MERPRAQSQQQQQLEPPRYTLHPCTIVTRYGTQKARHGVLTRVSEAVSNEIALLDGGNR